MFAIDPSANYAKMALGDPRYASISQGHMTWLGVKNPVPEFGTYARTRFALSENPVQTLQHYCIKGLSGKPLDIDIHYQSLFFDFDCFWRSLCCSPFLGKLQDGLRLGFGLHTSNVRILGLGVGIFV